MIFTAFRSARSSRKGFTIVELMVVIAIIGILSGIILTSLMGSKSKARDAQRISDLNQIQLAIEQYFDRCGQYPLTLTPGADNGCPVVGATQIDLGTYISVIPTDPTGGVPYGYIVNNQSYPTDYVLHAQLENQNAAQQNSYSSSSFQAFLSSASLTSLPGWTCFNNDTNYCISTR
jgi:prepilin-type N-terminal cleavage/methylation domain-containing protein